MTTDSERSSFMSAICDNPDDDTVRLAFSDWLEENDGENQSEYIRLGVEVARMDQEECENPVPRRPSIRSFPRLFRCGACEFCIAMRRLEHLHSVHGVTDKLSFIYGHTAESPNVSPPISGWPTIYFRRGFPWLVVLPYLTFTVPNAREILRYPVTEIRLSDKKPAQVNGADRDRGGSAWTWFLGNAIAVTSQNHIPMWLSDNLKKTWYPTREEAVGDLSAACMTWAKNCISGPLFR